MNLLLLYILSSLLLPMTSAGRLSCGQACQEALSYLVFDGTDPTAYYYKAQCRNKLRVQSIYICMRQYCTPRNVRAGLVDFNHTCEKYGGVTPPPYSVINEFTPKDTLALPKIAVANYTGSEVLKSPVFVLTELFDLAERTIDSWSDSEVTRADYGYAMFGFWGIVIFIGFVNRIVGFVKPVLQAKRPATTWTRKHKMLTKLQLWTKYWLTTPALWSRRTAEPAGWCTVPPRIQSLTISAFVIINVVLCCVSYNLFDGNLYWDKKGTQLSRYLADRAGVLAIANLPLLWTFGMRNNVLLWITGWNFSTFNMFHRWAARVATLEAVLHGIAYTVEAFLEGGNAEYYMDWAQRYWWCGVMSVITMSFMCALSIYPMRRYLYEVFLILHIALAVLMIVSLWYHVEIMAGEYNGYIWPCIAVWVFDRVVRIGRLVFFNLPLRSTTVSYDPGTDVVRLDFSTPTLLKPRSGTYYYIYLLQGTKFWESHPFTLSSWIEAHGGETSVDGKETRPLKNGSLSFIIRPHDSFTDRLRKSIVQKHEADCSGKAISTTRRVMIEGPYGHHLNLKRYDSVLFVVGGTGVTVALSHLCDLYYAAEYSRSPVIPTVRLVWAVRDLALFQDVYEKEISPQLRHRVRLDMQVYVTAGPTSPGVAESSADASGSSSPIAKEIGVFRGQELSMSGSRVTLFYHRPDILAVVATSVMAHTSDGNTGKLAVVSCGPPRMADDARAAVVKMLKEGHAELDFYPESFSW